jgi:hypothetical protein
VSGWILGVIRPCGVRLWLGVLRAGTVVCRIGIPPVSLRCRLGAVGRSGVVRCVEQWRDLG